MSSGLDLQEQKPQVKTNFHKSDTGREEGNKTITSNRDAFEDNGYFTHFFIPSTNASYECTVFQTLSQALGDNC